MAELSMRRWFFDARRRRVFTFVRRGRIDLSVCVSSGRLTSYHDVTAVSVGELTN